MKAVSLDSQSYYCLVEYTDKVAYSYCKSGIITVARCFRLALNIREVHHEEFVSCVFQSLDFRIEISGLVLSVEN